MLTGQTFVLCSVPKPPKRRDACLGWNSSWKKKTQNNSVLQSRCSDHSFVDSAGTCRLMGLGSRLGLNTGTCRHNHQYRYYQSRHILYLAVCKKVILCICSAIRTANLLLTSNVLFPALHCTSIVHCSPYCEVLVGIF